MHILLDHLNALLVAGMVILSLTTNQMRARHGGIDQVSAHSAKVKTLAFGQWVEDDILNIGENFGSNRYRFQAPVVNDTTGNTDQFEFYRDVENSDGSFTRHATRYQLVHVGEMERVSSGQMLQQYRLDRLSATTPVINGIALPIPSTGWTKNLESIGTLSFFEIEMLDRVGTVIPPDPSDPNSTAGADYLRVRFAVLPEYVLNPENFIRELYWVSTLKVRPFWDPPRDART